MKYARETPARWGGFEIKPAIASKQVKTEKTFSPPWTLPVFNITNIIIVIVVPKKPIVSTPLATSGERDSKNEKATRRAINKIKTRFIVMRN